MVDIYWVGLVRVKLGRFCRGFSMRQQKYLLGEGRVAEKGDVNIGFPLSRNQVYEQVRPVHLLLDLGQFTSTKFHGLIHIWIVGAPNQIIPHF